MLTFFALAVTTAHALLIAAGLKIQSDRFPSICDNAVARESRVLRSTTEIFEDLFTVRMVASYTIEEFVLGLAGLDESVFSFEEFFSCHRAPVRLARLKESDTGEGD
jgi:hypothetical protein